MAEIKEKTPFELRDERRYLSTLDTSEEEPEYKLKYESLYGFFRRKAKQHIDYHLDPKQKRKKPQRSTFKNRFDADEANKSPVKRSRPLTAKKSKPKQANANRFTDSLSIPQELDKAKALMNKRVGIIDSTIAQLTAEKQQLTRLKVITNRDQIVEVIYDIEKNHEGMVEDLEALLISLHEALRQVDKYAQSTQWKMNQIRDELNSERDQMLKSEQDKNKLQVQSLQQALDQVKKRLYKAEQNSAVASKVNDLERNLAELNKLSDDKQQLINKKSNQVEQLQTQINQKNSEIEHLKNELKKLQNLLHSTNEESSYKISNLNNEISLLTSQLKDTGDKLAYLQQSDMQKSQMFEQDREQQISKMRDEIYRLQQELDNRHQTAEIDEQGLLAENNWLKQELNRVASQAQGQFSQNDEVNRLRYILEDQERAFAKEREELKEAINLKERHRLKQKNEWAEIYTGLKHEIKELQTRVREATQENERLIRQLDRSHNENSESGYAIKAQSETLRQRLKEKDGETMALWEILQELQRTQQARGKIDFRDVQTLLVIKNLDDKARRKLK